ncbi:hypothetical protein [Chitinophaga rhizosphaerae]|uniref:hypothetical protein n=1 Tax=Chitinophaga rhizosphaerae TaxID=1864947 RepID=UPI000F80E012|nr:hypothetical protein [Chitinophaga rhizosphaerae]
MPQPIYDFMLNIHFAPTPRGEGQIAPPPRFTPCWSIARGLLEMFRMPVYQLHPISAHARKMEYHVSEVLVWDMRNASIAAKIVIEPEPNNGRPAVYIYLNEAYALASVLGIQDEKEIRRHEGWFQIPILNRGMENGSLVFTGNLDTILGTALGTYIPPDYLIDSSRCCVLFSGHQLGASSIDGEGINTQAVSFLHYFDRPIEALDYLMKQPSESFIQSTALDKNLPYLFEKAGILSWTDPPVMLATMFTVEEPASPDARIEDGSGRYITFKRDAINDFVEVDIVRRESVSIGNQMILRLDRWRAGEAIELQPTRASELIQEQLRFASVRSLSQKNFRCESTEVGRLAIKATNNRHASELSYRYEILHTDSIQEAFAELLRRPLPTYVGNPSDLKPGEHISGEAYVLDQEGRTIFGVMPHPRSNDIRDGLWLAVHPDWLFNPALLPIVPGHLAETIVKPHIEGDRYLFQIAHYIDGQLERTNSFRNLDILVSINFLTAKVDAQPEIATVPVPDSLGRIYHVDLNWHLQQPNGDQTFFKSRMGFDDAGQAADFFHFGIQSDYFTGRALQSIGVKAELLYATLGYGDRKLAAIKGFDKEKPDMHPIKYLWRGMPAPLQNALKAARSKYQSRLPQDINDQRARILDPDKVSKGNRPPKKGS